MFNDTEFIKLYVYLEYIMPLVILGILAGAVLIFTVATPYLDGVVKVFKKIDNRINKFIGWLKNE